MEYMEQPMPSLTIKSMPESIYRALKQSARAHHRSINGEALVCLERTLGGTRPSPAAQLARIDEIRTGFSARKLTERVLNEAKRSGRP